MDQGQEKWKNKRKRSLNPLPVKREKGEKKWTRNEEGGGGTGKRRK